MFSEVVLLILICFKIFKEGMIFKECSFLVIVTLKIFLISTVSEKGTAMVPMPCAY